MKPVLQVREMTNRKNVWTDYCCVRLPMPGQIDGPQFKLLLVNKVSRVDWLGNLLTFFVLCFVLLFPIEI